MRTPTSTRRFGHHPRRAAACAVVAGLVASLMLTTTTGTASAAPHSSLWMWGVVQHGPQPVWPDRRGETWYCSWQQIACPGPPQRPADPGDRPAWTADHLLIVLMCKKGGYYLVGDPSHTVPTAWMVADPTVVIPAEPERQLRWCAIWDEAGEVIDWQNT